MLRQVDFNPFAPGDFAGKRLLKLVEWLSGHCRAIKSYKLPQRRLQVVHFAAFWSRCKILACEVRACVESKNFGFDTAVLTSTFRFLSSPLFCFSCLIFFPCLAFNRLHFGGKGFRKALRNSGLDERKGRWVLEQDFHGNFQLNVTRFLPFSPVSLTELFSFWYGLKDHFTLHKLADKLILGHSNWWRHKWYKGRGSARAVSGDSGANWLKYNYNVVNEVLWLWRPTNFFVSQYMLATVKLRQTELRKHLFICSSLLTS